MSSPEAGIPPPAKTVTAVPEPATRVLLARRRR
jgi:hypothetical protein